MIVGMGLFTGGIVVAKNLIASTGYMVIQYNYAFFIAWVALAVVLKATIGSTIVYCRLKEKDVTVKHMPLA